MSLRSEIFEQPAVLAGLRPLLKEVVAGDLDGKEAVALFFSGGTDSLTVLWTLLDLGADVRCYVFALPRQERGDVAVASVAAALHHLPPRRRR